MKHLVLALLLPACVADESAEVAAPITTACCSTAPALVTWDPTQHASFVTVDYADLTVSDIAQQVRGSTRATLPRCSGKWYWEVHLEAVPGGSGSYPMIGVGTANELLAGGYIGGTDQGWSYYPADARRYHDASHGGWGPYGDLASTGDVIGVAMDLDAHTLTFYKNGVSMGAAFTNLSAGVPLYPMIGTAELYFTASARFSAPFEYAPPAGFAAYGGAPITRWDPSARASFVTLAHANVTANDLVQQVRGQARATSARTAGKWYWELRIDDDIPGSGGTSYPMVGLGTANELLEGGYIGGTDQGWSYYPADARRYHDASHGGWGPYGLLANAHDVIGVALDGDSHTLTFYKNGVSMGQAFGNVTPSTPLYPMVGTAELYVSATARFAAPFDAAAPAGYQPWDGTVARCSL